MSSPEAPLVGPSYYEIPSIKLPWDSSNSKAKYYNKRLPNKLLQITLNSVSFGSYLGVEGIELRAVSGSMT